MGRVGKVTLINLHPATFCYFRISIYIWSHDSGGAMGVSVQQHCK